MRVTYYALREVQVGDSVRRPGDLIPEANDWKYLSGYVADGTVAPVLVVTLPEEVQQMLSEWENAQNGSADTPEEGIEDGSVSEDKSKDEAKPEQPSAPAAKKPEKPEGKARR